MTSKLCLRASWFLVYLPRWMSWNFRKKLTFSHGTLFLKWVDLYQWNKQELIKILIQFLWLFNIEINKYKWKKYLGKLVIWLLVRMDKLSSTLKLYTEYRLNRYRWWCVRLWRAPSRGNVADRCLYDEGPGSVTSLLLLETASLRTTTVDLTQTSATVCKENHNSFFFQRIFGGLKSFLWGHWYPCFRLLVTSALGFKTRVDLSLAFFPSSYASLKFTSGATPVNLLTTIV